MDRLFGLERKGKAGRGKRERKKERKKENDCRVASYQLENTHQLLCLHSSWRAKFHLGFVQDGVKTGRAMVKLHMIFQLISFGSDESAHLNMQNRLF